MPLTMKENCSIPHFLLGKIGKIMHMATVRIGYGNQGAILAQSKCSIQAGQHCVTDEETEIQEGRMIV